MIYDSFFSRYSQLIKQLFIIVYWSLKSYKYLIFIISLSYVQLYIIII